MHFVVRIYNVFSVLRQRNAGLSFDQRLIYEFVSIFSSMPAATIDFSNERMFVLDFVLVVVRESVDGIHARGDFIDAVEVLVLRIVILEHVGPVFALVVQLGLDRLDLVRFDLLVIDDEVYHI